jgi:subtilisin family serine protease
MKKLLLLSLALLLMASGFAQVLIDPLLGEEMNRRNDNEQMTVVVIMKSQYDRVQLNRRADYFATRAERREFVVNELKAFAAASQYDLCRSLSEMRSNGMVTEPTVLWMANALYFNATKAAIQDLARRNDIEIIGFAKEHNWIPETEAPRQASATREITQNVFQVNADDVWALGYTGAGVVVAVIDTGVNYNHVDVADHLWDGGSEFPHHGYDVVHHDNDPMDDHGHGSHCSGTVLGDGTAGSQTGMAPDATLMCVKCLDANGNGGAQNISEGIQWAVEHGCDMFSMSLGIPNSSISERTLLRNTCVAALDAGIVAAIAAGNEGNNTWQYPIPNNVRVPGSCPPPYMDEVQGTNPGELSCSVCVGAVDYNDNAAYFTSRGPVTWQNTTFADYPYNPGIGLIRPDVCAPGVDIKSLNYQSNYGYTAMSGTSMATPCVAGCMALMLSKDINLSPSEVCRILEETAVPLSQGKSNTYGFGRVDVYQAVEAIKMGAIRYTSFAINDPDGNGNQRLNPGESVMIDLTLDNIADMSVSNVSVELSSNSPEVTITDNVVDFPNFAPNDTLTVENAFAFSVSEDVTSGQSIMFSIAISVDGELSGYFNFGVEVCDYALQYANTVVLNDNDGNGLLNPGETADLRIFIENIGNEMAQMLTGKLTTDYEFVTINDNDKSYSTMGAGMMGYADFNVTLDPDAPEGAAIPFTLDLEDAFGRHSELAFDFKNSCRVFFVLHDANGNGWQGSYLNVSYSDGSPAEQLTLEDGSEATFARDVALDSRIMLRWHSGQNVSQCSFELVYEDGTVIFENQGGFSGNKLFTINCTNGSSAFELCEPVRELSYSVDENLSVTLSWLAPENDTPIGYEVYREMVLLTMTTELTYKDFGLDEGAYNYCVYAVYDDCQSEFACIEAVVSMCGPVQNLRHALLTNDDNIQIILTWEAPENPTGLVEYQIYMDDELIGSTNELIYYLNTTIGYHDVIVKAVFENCDKDNQTEICILGRVENLNYVMDDHIVDLTWDALEYVSQYDVYINQVLVATVEDPSYSVELPSGIFEVMVGPVEEGCYRFLAGFDICIVDPIKDLSFVAMNDSGMHFVWSCDDPYVYNYEVIYNGDTTLVEPQGGATEFSFDPIVGENTICVIVHSLYGCYSEPVCLSKEVCPAVDGFDYVFNGNEVTVTWNGDADAYQVSLDGAEFVMVETNAYTAHLEGSHTIQVTPVEENCLVVASEFTFEVINVVPEITKTSVNVSEAAINVEWNAVEGAIAYNLYRDGERIAENYTETTYNDTEMAPDMQHCYTVQAVFEKGVSDQSEVACANYFIGLAENDGKVSIYPNPTSDKVTIECAGMTQIEVYSADGKLVQRIKVEGDTHQLDDLEVGNYTLRIKSGGNIFVRSIIKSR